MFFNREAVINGEAMIGTSPGRPRPGNRWERDNKAPEERYTNLCVNPLPGVKFFLPFPRARTPWARFYSASGRFCLNTTKTFSRITNLCTFSAEWLNSSLPGLRCAPTWACKGPVGPFLSFGQYCVFHSFENAGIMKIVEKYPGDFPREIY